MRSPGKSLRSEIAAYRARVAAHQVDDLRRKPALQLLDRWKDHASVETTWDMIAAAIPAESMVTAQEFISYMIERRDIAEALREVVEQGPSLESKARTQAIRAIRSKQEVSAALKTLENFRAESAALLGREKKTAPEKIFMSGWTELFRRLSGQPLHEAVRVLTEIAFDKDVTIEMVRAAEKPRDRGTRRSK